MTDRASPCELAAIRFLTGDAEPLALVVLADPTVQSYPDSRRRH
jgi:hypothetical protein